MQESRPSSQAMGAEVHEATRSTVEEIQQSLEQIQTNLDKATLNEEERGELSRVVSKILEEIDSKQPV